MAIVNDKTLVRYEFLEFLLRTDLTSFCTRSALDVQCLTMQSFIVSFSSLHNPKHSLIPILKNNNSSVVRVRDWS